MKKIIVVIKIIFLSILPVLFISCSEQKQVSLSLPDFPDTTVQQVCAALALQTTAANTSLYMCENCPMVFTKKQNFSRHSRIHSDEKLFKCNRCPKEFRQSSDRTKHMRVHTGKTPFKCTMCPKEFKQYSERIKHIRMHTNDRPYKCEHCGKTYTQKGHLNSHIKKLHPSQIQNADEAIKDATEPDITSTHHVKSLFDLEETKPFFFLEKPSENLNELFLSTEDFF